MAPFFVQIEQLQRQPPEMAGPRKQKWTLPQWQLPVYSRIRSRVAGIVSGLSRLRIGNDANFAVVVSSGRMPGPPPEPKTAAPHTLYL